MTVIKKLRCPDCLSKDIPRYIIEEYVGVTVYHPREDGYTDLDDVDQGQSSITRVRAVCRDCKYQWTIREVKDITDLEVPGAIVSNCLGLNDSDD